MHARGLKTMTTMTTTTTKTKTLRATTRSPAAAAVCARLLRAAPKMKKEQNPAAQSLVVAAAAAAGPSLHQLPEADLRRAQRVVRGQGVRVEERNPQHGVEGVVALPFLALARRSAGTATADVELELVVERRGAGPRDDGAPVGRRPPSQLGDKIPNLF